MLKPTPDGAVLRGSNSSSIVTGRAGLRFALSPNVNLYAVYGIGKRPEVLQLNPTTPSQLIPAETLKSGEAGIKFRLLGGRLVGDASVFYYKYSNFQTLGLRNGIVATVNAGKADAYGFETQLSYEITPGISIFGSYGFNHGRFRAGLYDGNRFRNSPDHKFAIGGNFEAPLAGGTIGFAPMYSWQSKMFFFEDNDRLDLQQRVPAAYSDRVVDEYQNGFGQLSARITFAPENKRWSVALIGDNLTDKKHLVDAGNTGTISAFRLLSPARGAPCAPNSGSHSDTTQHDKERFDEFVYAVHAPRDDGLRAVRRRDRRDPAAGLRRG